MLDDEIARAVGEFRSAAEQKADGGSSPKEDARLHAQMSAAWHCLDAFGGAGRSAFKRLLQDPSPYVRSWVAAQLLSDGDVDGEPVLEEIEAQGGMRGFIARMTLDQWRKGKLGSPFPANR